MESLHNHTTFSDGRSLPEQLVKKAIESKLKTLAITDHYEYFTGFFGFKSNIDIYFMVLRHLKKKYSKEIKILAGLEIDLQVCEEADLPMEFIDDLDLVLFERLESYKDLDRLARLTRLLKPVKVGLAHPELKDIDFGKLVDFLEENEIFVELNTSCYSYYGEKAPLTFETQEEFFKLLKGRPVKVSIGSDAHLKDDLTAGLERAYDFAERMDLVLIDF
ncbi:MAG: PHP domain-containing protein [Nanoarchaeota archaeon]|nr:PHP domain-containing protein [Nanoarchaeota archaeon]